MHEITKEKYGVKIVVAGLISDDEVESAISELKNIFMQMKGEYCAIVDIRDCKAVTEKGQKIISEAMMFSRESEILRSAIIVSNPVAAAQYRRMAIESGIYNRQRYIEASVFENWEELALDWINNGVDPYIKMEISQPAV